MRGYYISVNVRADSLESVRNAVIGVCEAEGLPLIQVDPAERVVDDEDKLPEGEDWYGLLVSGIAAPGWVTIYVDDWKDSGYLAKALSRHFDKTVMEIWVAQDIHWGYTCFSGGSVTDRYADDPSLVIDTPEEGPLYKGDPAAMASIATAPAEQLQDILELGRANTGKFAGVAISSLCEALSLPFERVFTSYEHFFTDDPEDFAVEHTDWPQFRHYSFSLPEDRDSLAG